jgi:putative ABC transport system permease protein
MVFFRSRINRKICVVTGSRSEYGLFYPVLLKIKESRFDEIAIEDLSSYTSAEADGKKCNLVKYVELGSSAYKVVGVFQDDGGDREERLIYMPYTTRQVLEKNNDKISQIIVSFRPEIGHAGALAFEKQLRLFMKNKKSIDPTDENGIYIRNVADQLKKNQQFAGVLQLIVTFVGIGALIAGIIGISNIMVFVVKERTKELGIRKALGATPKSVINMILHESIFITTISGFVGMIGGIILLKSIGEELKDFFILNPYIESSTAIFSTFLLILFGAIAGYIPAKRAASIKPIVALRDE